ncbi:MAG: DUF790 family protein [Candidatus Methanomethyliaceae archaeon]|nr:DUF790 family protein [Candidatus Methanomethyliaceae archaeon]MDW7970477.1 DUF790 family protein [Nitrososphaerota archaeon]
MLPFELLPIVHRGNHIWPKYSKLNDVDLSITRAIIQTYENSIGLRRREIKEKITDLENLYGSYKLVRGLSTLIERECLFKSSYSIDPKAIRQALFEKASELGYPINQEERNKIIEIIAKEFKLTPEEIEQSIYADLKSEDILLNVKKINPMDLLKEYNLSLTQTLLFHAIEMNFSVGGNWQRIFRAIKYYGLIYSLKGSGWFKIDGPASILKLTRRYGMAMAKVLPEILSGRHWQIESNILYRNKIFCFKLDSKKHAWLFPCFELKESYDSALEEEFAAEFKALNTPWIIKRETEPIYLENCIMIPDFSFHFTNKKVIMEIVGFWTREYLMRKLEKLKNVKEPIIVAINESLACDKVEKLSSNPNLHLIYYKDKIPLREVLSFLQSIMEEEVKKCASELSLDIKAPIETIDEIAKRLKLPLEAIRAAADKVKTHVLIGNTFIEKRLMEEIREMLINLVNDEAPLKKVLEALERFNLPDAISIITMCGFQIKWRGLSVENAWVKKINHSI